MSEIAPVGAIPMSSGRRARSSETDRELQAGLAPLVALWLDALGGSSMIARRAARQARLGANSTKRESAGVLFKVNVCPTWHDNVFSCCYAQVAQSPGARAADAPRMVGTGGDWGL